MTTGKNIFEFSIYCYKTIIGANPYFMGVVFEEKRRINDIFIFEELKIEFLSRPIIINQFIVIIGCPQISSMIFQDRIITVEVVLIGTCMMHFDLDELLRQSIKSIN